jgi:serine/threonine protein kinase
VLLYYLVSGLLPFPGNSKREIIARILRGRYDLDENDIWYFISEDIKDLIRGMLEHKPEKRLTA